MVICGSISNLTAQRTTIPLNSHWYTIATSGDTLLPLNYFEKQPDSNWTEVSVPHNWDAYEGYRRLLHGNRHGDSWYKKEFTLKHPKQGKKFWIQFEGVGSYATVYLNNIFLGSHAGGRTSFTLDATAAIYTDGRSNKLAVRAWHPSNIKDLPWVCGGCSEERGFSEGSQPMGIFRPVKLLITNDVHVVPFGVHAFASIQENKASLHVSVTLQNNDTVARTLQIINQLCNANGNVVATGSQSFQINRHDSITLDASDIKVTNPILWQPGKSYLYNIVTLVKERGKIIDRIETPFGFRTLQWKGTTNQLLVNGKPVFINGVAEYEHLLGQSHAFSKQQIEARVKWIQAAGFNAFRDGHQPHNLLYGQWFDKLGILWWTQHSAHVWYDTPEFRSQFKHLLKEWIIERRNSPSVILWGLQNESKLPEDFARECTELIRTLDPTASSQRLVTTCNGGSGTDWDVPQNWTGTYGGNPDNYAADLKEQVLVGEYGAWRTLDLHTEGGFVQQDGYSEDRFTHLMEKKIRLAESVKDSVAGHFFWLLTSHDNPGRVQGGEGNRELDRIGPVNYKGMLTPWEEPTDVYYMYRSNYTNPHKQPMVYIASHTWPNRWLQPGIKDGIRVYSNCEEVELFNDIEQASLGRRRRNGMGTHFLWNGASIKYNLLYAVGYVKGVPVARDTLVLMHLPQAPNFKALFSKGEVLSQAEPGKHYWYRINCGGPAYTDTYGQLWQADFGFAKSWTSQFEGMPEAFASQRRIFAPIKNTQHWPLFQTFRYGRNALQYYLPLPNGHYQVELYFAEPWLGVGGGLNAAGMRQFDVAINGKRVLNNLDIFNEAGSQAALKKVVQAKVTNGILHLAFPEVHAGQAVIAAIAVASAHKKPGVIKPGQSNSPWKTSNCSVQYWLDIGQQVFDSSDVCFNELPPYLFGATWVRMKDTTKPAILQLNAAEALELYFGLQYQPHVSTNIGEPLPSTIITNKEAAVPYHLYRRIINAGTDTTITLSQHTLLAIKPLTQMQPAYDLKPVTPYRANVAVLAMGAIRDTVQGRECVIIKSGGKVTVNWPVNTGVADRYAMTMKYFYAGTTPLAGILQMLDAGGNRMVEENVNFTFTRPGKWNQFTINTPTQINAGHYNIRLIIQQADGLAISGIEVQ